MHTRTRRRGLGYALWCLALAALTAAGFPNPARAAQKIRFSLDWRFEGQTSFVWLADQKGYFKAEGLDVQIDAGNGSGAAIQRVASGAYDVAIGDMSSLIEAVGNNPTLMSGMQMVYLMYDEAPVGYVALKSTGIKSIRDLQGKTIGAATFDVTRKLWPMVAQAAGMKADDVKFMQVTSQLRANMVSKGEIDAAGGFYNMPMEFEERGVPRDQLVVLKLSDLGLRLYGNGLIFSGKMLNENPEAVKAFVRAFNRAFREGLADPVASVKALKQQEAIVHERVELERFRLLMPAMLTNYVRAEGLGNVDPVLLARQVDGIYMAQGLKSKPDPTTLFNAAFLPPVQDRMPIVPKP